MMEKRKKKIENRNIVKKARIHLICLDSNGPFVSLASVFSLRERSS